MLLRLPNPAARFALLVLAFALATTLTFFPVRNARAANQAELGTRAGYEAAASLEPANPENWYLLGRYWQYTLDDPDPALAINNFRRALALNPRYADAWLDLGTAYESEGDFSVAPGRSPASLSGNSPRRVRRPQAQRRGLLALLARRSQR